MSDAPARPRRLRPALTPARLLELALEAAGRAGALLRDGRPDDLGVAATKSSPIDVVTEMDIAAEKLITVLPRTSTGPTTGSSARRARAARALTGIPG